MHNDETLHSKEGESILSIIQEIKDGTVNPKTLAKEDRQRCVEFLIGEGYTEAQTAQILARSEKTVSRDLVDLRARNALTPNVELAKQIVGDMFQKAMAHHKYLMRLARSPDASHSEKAQSEFLAWKVLKEVVEKMQTLGYLPLKPQEIIEDIFHHVTDDDKEQGIAESKNMLLDIERASRESGTIDPATEEKIKLLRQKIEEAEISHEVTKLAKKSDASTTNKEDPQ
ncbi:MAG: hypothetical protein KBB52_02510 [Candidatus Omnitrophica bacterium]|nr:hypothetical protein [Candidatus Omnitrophota bacterium]